MLGFRVSGFRFRVKVRVMVMVRVPVYSYSLRLYEYLFIYVWACLAVYENSTSNFPLHITIIGHCRPKFVTQTLAITAVFIVVFLTETWGLGLYSHRVET